MSALLYKVCVTVYFFIRSVSYFEQLTPYLHGLPIGIG